MKLFVGLGNLGQKYAKNRHNVGFMAIDGIHQHFEFSAWKKKFSGLIADGTIAGERVLVLKPQTYMNESGRAVAATARFYKISAEDVFVFYDEIDLAPGKLKVKQGGGNAGHNGLRSITAEFSNDYQRIRIGVGHPGQKDQVANYVLSDFAKADQDWLQPMLDAIAKASQHLANSDNARFLSEVALLLKPEKPAKPGARKIGVKSQQPRKKDPPTPAPAPDNATQNDPKTAGRDRRQTPQTSLADGLKAWLKRGK